MLALHYSLGRRSLSAVAAVALMAIGGAAGSAWATAIFTATEIAGDVVVTGSGSLNLGAAINPVNGNARGSVKPDGLLFVGPAPLGSVTAYTILSGTGPTSIGPGTTYLPATSGTGDIFGINAISSGGTSLVVPLGYSSGSPLSGTSTYVGETFASLGLTPGTYVWSWGSGASADSLTLTVPEPSTILLLATGLVALPLAGRRASTRS